MGKRQLTALLGSQQSLMTSLKSYPLFSVTNYIYIIVQPPPLSMLKACSSSQEENL